MTTPPTHSARTVARELATIAHARALHALHPILRMGSPAQRDIVYRTMAEEFSDLESTVERLLAPVLRAMARDQSEGSVTTTQSGAVHTERPQQPLEARR